MPGFEIFGDEERHEVNDVLETGVLFRYGFDQARQGHWKARTFETELAQRVGAQHCHLCGSGTAAVSTALAACGVGAGDEVIIPPFTFVATFEAVLLAGAVPLFAEIDETLCLDPKKLEPLLTPRTKALMPVHMCGAMAAIDTLKAFADRKGLMLVEDACQSLGATLGGKAVGTFGQMGCFSFDPVKTITCGEGGAIVTDDNDLYQVAQAYADHGHDHVGTDRGLEDHPIMGTNYRISELNAAVGLAQLRKLDAILATQRRHKQLLKDTLAAFPAIEFRRIPDPAGDSATFLSFFLPDADTARQTVKALGKAGIDGCFYWYDNKWHYIRQWEHLQQLKAPAKLPIALLDQRPDFAAVALPQSDAIMRRTVSMLIKLAWTDDELQQRCRIVHETLKEVL
jgi:8-amino-3,8-dideoxy-alpha-D-manno-octulosonate transaminase